MSSKSVVNFVDTVIQHYPPFRWDDDQEKAWVNTMVRELSGFSDNVLDRAITEMVRTRKERRIPLVSECIDACVETKRWIEREENAGKLPEFRSANDEWSSERQKLAYDLVKSGMGRHAAQDDPCWIMALWDFCRKNQRLPAGNEIDQCKRNAREFDEAYRVALRGEATDANGIVTDLPNAKALQNFGASMLAKREKLREEVLGR